MPTPVLDVRASAEAGPAIERAAGVLRAGGVVAFPTETVYGLGANALDPEAVAAIFRAKGRPANNPLIVHVAEVADVHRLVAHWPDEAARLAERFWPGPLTLVLPRGPAVPDVVTAGGPTVAVRMPAHELARRLIKAAGVPVAAPSANRSGGVSPTRAKHVLAGLDGRVDLILDGGPVTGGIESTVLDLTHRPARLLRPGLIAPHEIEAVIGPITRGASEVREATEALPSPGMLTRHYAPKTPLECVEELTEEDFARIARFAAEGSPTCILHRVADFTKLPERKPFSSSGMPNDPAGYAALLYDRLHALDGRYGRIVVLMPPDTEEWLAVRDRLRRAGAKE